MQRNAVIHAVKPRRHAGLKIKIDGNCECSQIVFLTDVYVAKSKQIENLIAAEIAVDVKIG